MSLWIWIVNRRIIHPLGEKWGRGGMILMGKLKDLDESRYTLFTTWTALGANQVFTMRTWQLTAGLVAWPSKCLLELS